jgi:hypothetical protein
VTDPYAQIALERPNDVAIGGALITMVEPDPGFEHAYNRWYEDDHFYSGAMQGPWVFAGRRFVAPRQLRERRPVATSPAVDPPDAGCYISCYWITAGHESAAERWSYLAMAEALMPDGRGFTQRRHVYTAFHRYCFAVLRENGPMKPHLALDASYSGLLVQIIDTPDPAAIRTVEQRLREDVLPRALEGSTAAMVLAFAPKAFSQGLINDPSTPAVAPPDKVGSRLCLLWFLDEDPTSVRDEDLHRLSWMQGAADIGTLAFSGAFVPTVIGTDRYVDELR